MEGRHLVCFSFEGDDGDVLVSAHDDAFDVAVEREKVEELFVAEVRAYVEHQEEVSGF